MLSARVGKDGSCPGISKFGCKLESPGSVRKYGLGPTPRRSLTIRTFESFPGDPAVSEDHCSGPAGLFVVPLQLTSFYVLAFLLY